MLNLTKWNNLSGLGPYYILEADFINAPRNIIDKVRDEWRLIASITELKINEIKSGLHSFVLHIPFLLTMVI